MMHRLVATVNVPDAAAAAAAIDAEAGRSEWVEVRLDGLWNDVPDQAQATDDLVVLHEAATRAAAAGTQLLATLRPTRQGGAYDGSEQVRLGMLVAAAKAGFHAVDVEADHADNEATVAAMRGDAEAIVVSDHTPPTTPSREEGMHRLLRMQDLHVEAEKLAFPAGSFLDLLRAAELIHGHGERHGRPAVAPMGYGGAQARALLAVIGNRLTYGHAAGSPPAIPGQPAAHDIASIWDHWNLSRAELGRHGPWMAVLGGDVAHSLSPRIHNAALRAAARPERFGALDVPDSVGAMRLVASVASRIGLAGASVTHPLKGHALTVADHADDTARAVGAANCLRFDAGGASATNTDATALFRMMQGAVDAGARTALILGAGGAARAAMWAAGQHGLDIHFTSRDADRARATQAALGGAWTPWNERADLRGDIIVQATPLGSGPADATPIDPAAMAGCRLAIEMVYAHGTTAFETVAAGQGAEVMDGTRLLVEQAKDAWTHWFGRDAPAAAMEQAVQGAR